MSAKGNSGFRSTTLWYVEDDFAIARNVREYFEARDCSVRIFEDGYALQKIASDSLPIPDLIIMDWNLPGMSGIALCKWIRKRHPELPIIMLTVRDDPNDIVRGLESGADDYVVKPFDIEVLAARAQALLRRTQPISRLECGSVSLDLSSAQVFVSGQLCELGALEYRLLELLLRNKGRILSREIIRETLWEANGQYVADNTLTVTVKRLREKLGKEFNLKTVRSIGYRLEDSW